MKNAVICDVSQANVKETEIREETLLTDNSMCGVLFFISYIHCKYVYGRTC